MPSRARIHKPNYIWALNVPESLAAPARRRHYYVDIPILFLKNGSNVVHDAEPNCMDPATPARA